MSDDEPEAPTGVRLVDPDGIEHPVEVYYAGDTSDGIARWYVISRETFPLAGLRVDRLPPHSELILPRNDEDNA